MGTAGELLWDGWPLPLGLLPSHTPPRPAWSLARSQADPDPPEPQGNASRLTPVITAQSDAVTRSSTTQSRVAARMVAQSEAKRGPLAASGSLLLSLRPGARPRPLLPDLRSDRLPARPVPLPFPATVLLRGSQTRR